MNNLLSIVENLRQLNFTEEMMTYLVPEYEKIFTITNFIHGIMTKFNTSHVGNLRNFVIKIKKYSDENHVNQISLKRMNELSNEFETFLRNNSNLERFVFSNPTDEEKAVSEDGEEEEVREIDRAAENMMELSQLDTDIITPTTTNTSTPVLNNTRNITTNVIKSFYANQDSGVKRNKRKSKSSPRTEKKTKSIKAIESVGEVFNESEKESEDENMSQDYNDSQGNETEDQNNENQEDNLEIPKDSKDMFEDFKQFSEGTIDEAYENLRKEPGNWRLFLINQIQSNVYKNYSGKRIKKHQLIKKFDTESSIFRLQLVNLTPFGAKLCLRMIKLFHENILPPKSRRWYLVENVLDKDLQSNMEDLFNMLLLDDKHWESINNHKEGNGRRMQIDLDKYAPGVLFIKEIQIILQWFNILHNVNSPFLLYTEEDCPDQCFHTDDQSSFTNIMGENDVLSYHAIVAFEKPCEVRFAKEYLSCEKESETIIISPFSMVIFCGNTLHSFLFKLIK